MYQALYRKWRPRTFDEVVGQAHITETLRRQVAAQRLSHAYLFTGTRGTGKTTCAKILARAVNCEHPVEGNPCNCCPACLGIENGSVLDVLELDAASNNGVDQIRALRDEAVYTPALVRRRVYIVDEVHMLSTAAFNALLKILEEPPAHLLFILATTELHKVPATIKSRCQQFAFKRITPGDIAGQLSKIAQAEQIPLTREAAQLLARLADGGLRDALSLLDQCSGGEEPLDENRVLDVLGLAGNRKTATIMHCIAREDTAGALEALGNLYREGKDMGAFLGELATLTRDLLLRRTAPEGGSGLLSGSCDSQTAKELGEGFTAAELVQMLTILQRAQADLYRSSSRRMDAELCLIRLCDRRLAETQEGLVARISRLEEKLARGIVPTAPPEPEPPPTPPPQEMLEVKVESTDRPPWEEEPPPASTAPQRASAPPSATAPTPPGNEWSAFLARVPMEQLSRPAQSFLAHLPAENGVFGENGLTLWVDAEVAQRTLSRKEVLQILTAAAEGISGHPVRVQIKLGKPEATEAPGRASEKVPQKEENWNDLLEFGRQFQNITIKEKE